MPFAYQLRAQPLTTIYAQQNGFAAWSLNPWYALLMLLMFVLCLSWHSCSCWCSFAVLLLLSALISFLIPLSHHDGWLDGGLVVWMENVIWAVLAVLGLGWVVLMECVVDGMHKCTGWGEMKWICLPGCSMRRVICILAWAASLCAFAPLCLMFLGSIDHYDSSACLGKC